MSNSGDSGGSGGFDDFADMSNPEVIMEQQENVDSLVGLFIQFGLTLVTGVAAVAFFAVMRTRNQIVYNPRTFFSKDKEYVPPKLKGTLFGWITDLINNGIQSVTLYAGIDAAIYLLFLLMMFKIFALASIPGVGLIVLHYILNPSTTGEATLVGGSSVSVLSKPNFFWVHTVCIYYFTIVVMWQIRWMWLSYIHIRQSLWFRAHQYIKSTHARSIIVTDLPQYKNLGGSDDALAHWLVGRGVNKFRHALWGRDVHQLDELITKREELVQKLETGMVKKYKKVSPSDAKNERQLPDELQKLVNQIKELEHRIVRAREEATPETFAALNGGFATFASLDDAHDVARGWYVSRSKQGFTGLINMTARGASNAAEAVGNVANRAMGGNEQEAQYQAQAKELKIKSDFRLRLAPHPKNVIWDNLAITPSRRKFLRRRGRLILFILGALWVIPVSILTVVTQLDALLSIMPVEVRNFFTANSFVKGGIESVLSPLVFTLFLAFLPNIVRAITRGQRAVVSKADGVKLNMGKIFYFYIAGFFVLFTLMSSLVGFFGALSRIIQSGGFTWEWITSQGFDFVKMIPSTFIQRGAFWINYVSLNGPGALPVELAQGGRLVVRWFNSSVRTLTPRQELEATKPPPFVYDFQYAYGVFIASLGFVYFAHHPLILILITIYFGVAFIVYKYQLSYVHETKVESGGSIWPRVCQRMLFALAFGQIISMVQFILLGAWGPGACIMPLVIATLVAMYWVRVTFGLAAKFLDPRYKVELIQRDHETEGHSSGNSLSRRLTKNVKTIPRSARNVVKYNSMLLHSDSQSTAGPESVNVEKYLPPALIMDLMFPMVPEHLQHLLTPFFPELEKLQSRQRKSMIVQMNGPQGGTANLFGTVHVPAQGGKVELEPGHGGRGGNEKLREVESTRSNDGAHAAQAPPLYPAPQTQIMYPGQQFQSPLEAQNMSFAMPQNAQGHRPMHPNGGSPQQWQSSSSIPYPQQQHPGSPQVHHSQATYQSSSASTADYSNSYGHNPQHRNMAQTEGTHYGRPGDHSPDIQMNRFR